jgi:hypothetical protein
MTPSRNTDAERFARELALRRNQAISNQAINNLITEILRREVERERRKAMQDVEERIHRIDEIVEHVKQRSVPDSRPRDEIAAERDERDYVD